MFNENQVFETMKDWILTMKDLEEDQITPNADFRQLGFDSLDFVEFQFNIQKDYNIELKPELLTSQKITNLHQLIQYIISESELNNTDSRSLDV
ncbi:hypothetical protein PL78_15045 [Yersinia entomophaga]|uniref:Carrier domain-containing protein n=1 Tax=Yersinia entomophaga TaxID=935293 RepID=A0ABM6BP39_YERET|nr:MULTISPECIES: phosphopantetheine-binding protein [Yersinia]ANI31130.1 hypothetical protein PL78_15045 [Yersinia entomophaga]OWF86338.1 hypothetical protein B4914_15110 [Yersinia entomophaga]